MGQGGEFWMDALVGEYRAERAERVEKRGEREGGYNQIFFPPTFSRSFPTSTTSPGASYVITLIFEDPRVVLKVGRLPKGERRNLGWPNMGKDQGKSCVGFIVCGE